eukprot:1933455-Pleurochrysis_carterae.AAC.2
MKCSSQGPWRSGCGSGAAAPTMWTRGAEAPLPPHKGQPLTAAAGGAAAGGWSQRPHSQE